MWERDEGREGLSWFSKFLRAPRPGSPGGLCHRSWTAGLSHPSVAHIFQLSGGSEGGPQLTKEREPLTRLDPSSTPGWNPLPAKPQQTTLPLGLELELLLVVVAAQARQTFPRPAGGQRCWACERLGVPVGTRGARVCSVPWGAVDGNFLSPRGTMTSSPGPST